MDAKLGLCQPGHCCEGLESKVITLIPGWRMNVRGSLEPRRPGVQLLQGREKLVTGGGHGGNDSETRNKRVKS